MGKFNVGDLVWVMWKLGPLRSKQDLGILCKVYKSHDEFRTLCEVSTPTNPGMSAFADQLRCAITYPNGWVDEQ